MSLSDIAMNAITLGGHSRLQATRNAYDERYKVYLVERDELVRSNEELRSNLAELGQVTKASMKTLARVQRVLNLSREEALHVPRGGEGIEQSSVYVRTQISGLLTQHSATTSLASGMGLGSAVAAGSWSLVGLMGTASTGTAIGTLSGAAATNATLAWFGGGAIAAGGAGMAGGTLVLGGLAVAPAIALASWHSRSKARAVVAELERVEREISSIGAASSLARNNRQVVLAKFHQLHSGYGPFAAEVDEVIADLFPIPFMSYCLRLLRKLTGRPAFSAPELHTVGRLSRRSREFMVQFEGDPLPAQSSAPAAL